MENVITKSPACRLEMPQYYFVDVQSVPNIRRQQILSSFNAGDLQNKVTQQSIADALDNLTK